MHKQCSVAGGIVLIFIGLFFLALQFEVTRFLNISTQWPLFIALAGDVFLAAALLTRPPLAVPGVVVGGIGLLLYYQNLTGDWAFQGLRTYN